jgi:hypothetical protein
VNERKQPRRRPRECPEGSARNGPSGRRGVDIGTRIQEVVLLRRQVAICGRRRAHVWGQSKWAQIKLGFERIRKTVFLIALQRRIANAFLQALAMSALRGQLALVDCSDPGCRRAVGCGVRRAEGLGIWQRCHSWLGRAEGRRDQFSIISFMVRDW